MAKELASLEGLSEISRRELSLLADLPSHQEWLTRLDAHLARVRRASLEEFLSEDFQRELWESEAISATGMGHVNVDLVIKDQAIAKYLWDFKESFSQHGGSVDQTRLVIDTWDKLRELVTPLTNRLPRLKMYRVMAAIRPENFTTIAHMHKLKMLARAMGISKGVEHSILLHQRVIDRIGKALPSVARPSKYGPLDRMTLPWVLFARYVQEQGEEATEIAGDTPGEEKLKPLPADRRRRGMLAIAGSLPTVRAMIEFAKDGCNREDFREHIRSVNPKLAPASVNTNVNALIAEWGVLRASGDELFLTSRGEALLETGEPEEVSDWLLTRILGFDNLLKLLSDGPRGGKQLVVDLQLVNPGWTSSFAPTAMINWVKSMGLVEVVPGKAIALTERGKEWADRIHWVPEVLAPVAKSFGVKATGVSSVESLTKLEDEALVRPTLAQIITGMPPGVKFSDTLIGRLDAGLWSHKRRHFAVLTGLSGAGKTLLARSYALGLWAGEPDPSKGLCTVPVQPGWHDPASLLGYVNPMNSEVYVRTKFLDFLLEAKEDPDRPYTVILDEMNLSHPEQYLAPLLSAMETGDAIDLHAQGDDVDGVPEQVMYPDNLLIIGTVNMDETTHGLSDKVLDRASVIEFWDIDVDAYPAWSTVSLSDVEVTTVRVVLRDLVEALKTVRLHFGWRTIDDVIGYVCAARSGGVIEFRSALDHAIYSKVLPKLRGEDTVRLQRAFGRVKEILRASSLTESETKVDELIADLAHLGSARFWR